jgi:MOSC domain-containing protein YiiM
MGEVLEIFIAPARGAPMQFRSAVTATADTGLTGDRYASATNRRSPDYQVTLIELENIEAYRQTIDAAFSNDLPRRNIVTRGIALNEMVSKRFRVGAVVIEGLE